METEALYLGVVIVVLLVVIVYYTRRNGKSEAEYFDPVEAAGQMFRSAGTSGSKLEYLVTDGQIQGLFKPTEDLVTDRQINLMFGGSEHLDQPSISSMFGQRW